MIVLCISLHSKRNSIYSGNRTIHWIDNIAIPMVKPPIVVFITSLCPILNIAKILERHVVLWIFVQLNIFQN